MAWFLLSTLVWSYFLFAGLLSRTRPVKIFIKVCGILMLLTFLIFIYVGLFGDISSYTGCPEPKSSGWLDWLFRSKSSLVTPLTPTEVAVHTTMINADFLNAIVNHCKGLSQEAFTLSQSNNPTAATVSRTCWDVYSLVQQGVSKSNAELARMNINKSTSRHLVRVTNCSTKRGYAFC
jgi:hypothetical protein